MTTFTTEDRIIAEKDGSFTVNVEGGTVLSPPHIVDSGASVMNNKPVAWMLTLPDGTHDWILDGKGCEGYIPLYTHLVNPKYDPETGEPLIDGYPLFSGLPHPVKELTDRIAELEKQLDTRTRELIGASFYEHDYKTLMAKPPLTDKEIEEVAVINLGHSMGLLNWMGFARAILRKAQEK
jgi:hypothetical protein